MKKLVEGMLSVGSRLTEDYRPRHIVHRLAKAVDRLAVRLHVKLL